MGATEAREQSEKTQEGTLIHQPHCGLVNNDCTV